MGTTGGSTDLSPSILSSILQFAISSSPPAAYSSTPRELKLAMALETKTTRLLTVLLAALTGFPVATNSTGCGRPAAISSGTYTTTINDVQRQYLVRVLTSYNSNKAYRLVIAFHWLAGNMQNVVSSTGYYGLQALAAESTIFVAPQGLSNAWPNTNDRDLAFLDYLVQTLDAGLCVDSTQRFATGFSYGAFMSHSLACSRPTVFRGVVLLSGGEYSGCTGGTTPVAYFLAHGVSDTTIPIANGRALRDKFVKANGCKAQSAAEPAVGSGTHIKTEYQGCSAGHPVTWVANDGGHTFSPVDSGSKKWAPTEMWTFISQFK